MRPGLCGLAPLDAHVDRTVIGLFYTQKPVRSGALLQVDSGGYASYVERRYTRNAWVANITITTVKISKSPELIHTALSSVPSTA